jgi:type II secretory ATPase GspE/PulE/Tfp pilus assembly ATPase PilB-like protein
MNTIKTAALKKGMRTFKDDALRKAAAGITSVREVLRVAG